MKKMTSTDRGKPKPGPSGEATESHHPLDDPLRLLPARAQRPMSEGPTFVENRLEPFLDEGGPLAYRPLGVSREQSQRVIKRMM